VGLAEQVARRYLRLADRLLPGRVVGLYVVGSAALGEHVPGRSDVDLVALLDGHVDGRALARLRALHLLGGGSAASRSLARRHLPTTGTPNVVFVDRRDVSTPVTRIRPVASHTALSFEVGRAFDVNPVVWTTLATRGIAIRGPAPPELGLDPEPGLLREWNLDNLRQYWLPWGRAAASPGGPSLRSQRIRHGRAWMVAWGVLGPPRLHRTIATGEIIGKRTAGAYARATFEDRWHPLVDKALSYWRRDPVRVEPGDVRRAGDFAVMVTEAASQL
jgi:hypothetical protein